MPYPSLYDPAGRTLLAFYGTLNPSAIPSTLVLDQEGRVAASIARRGRPARQTLVDLVRDVAEGRGLVTPLDLGDWFAAQAHDGSLLLAIPVAMVAGLVSFFSPCVVPLLPGYLSYATGLSGADLGDARRGRMLDRLAAVRARLLLRLRLLRRADRRRSGSGCSPTSADSPIVLGILTILLGLVFLGVVPWMQRDWRIHQVPAVGLAAAPLLGVLFGLGWAPCIGPTLSAVLFLSRQRGHGRARGAADLRLLPRASGCRSSSRRWPTAGCSAPSRWVRRHQQWVTAIGGLMLIAVGLLLVTGWWDEMVDWIRTWFFPGFEAGV